MARAVSIFRKEKLVKQAGALLTPLVACIVYLSTLTKWASLSHEMSVNFYQTKCYRIPEDIALHIYKQNSMV
jgi:hypothetical protein